MSADNAADTIRRDVEQFYETWAGTADQQQAAQAVSAHLLNGAYAECMQREGYDTYWQVAMHRIVPKDALSASIWLAEPHRAFYSTEFIADASWSRSEDQMSRSLPEDENTASLECHDSITPASDSEVESVRHPPGLDSLQQKWDQTLVEATNQYGSRSDYLACLAKADLPGKPAGSADFDSMDAAYARAKPRTGDIPASPGASPSEPWSDFLRLEGRLSDADWNCRSTAYASGIDLMPDIVAQFQTANAEAIDSLSEQWRLLESEARALGWTP